MKLADFGIAKLLGDSAGHTRTGATIGSAAYLSPEQVRGEQVTGATDVYSLGLVLLEALTGERAFPGPAMEAAVARLHRGPAIPTDLPPGWQPLLVAMLTTDDVAARPSAAEVAARLRALDAADVTRPLTEVTTTSAATTVPSVTRPVGHRVRPAAGPGPSPPRPGRQHAGAPPRPRRRRCGARAAARARLGGRGREWRHR